MNDARLLTDDDYREVEGQEYVSVTSLRRLVDRLNVSPNAIPIGRIVLDRFAETVETRGMNVEREIAERWGNGEVH